MSENNERISDIFKYSVENAIFPILWMTEDGIIIYHNKALSEYTGGDSFLNTHIYRLSSDIKHGDWVCLWEKLSENQTRKERYEFYNKKLDKIYIFNILSTKVKLDDEFYCHMVAMDITDQVETNLRLLKQKQRTEESERLKDAFLANMSHEIRTPMNAIVGFSELLDKYIDDKLRDYTKIITENVDYLLSLIDNIIMVSRLDSKQMKIKYDTFDMMDILDEINISYTNKFIKQNNQMKVIIDNTDNQLVESDRYMIEECLYRLIDNSIKFSDLGDIHIGFYLMDNKITIYVKDSGVGIENKHHEIIFDRFRQINKQTTGAGLGLSIFKSFVSLLGGRYSITSRLNEGTLISFTIDIKIELSRKCHPSINNTNTDKLINKRILVVEDMEINQLLIHDMLLPYEVNLIKCMDGKECMEKFYEITDIDLILMDLDMPHMDGYEATKLIRERDKVIPIIAQTAYSQKENRERGRKMGINDFLVKPITRDKIVKIILKHL